MFNCQDGYVSWELHVAALGVKTNAIVELMKQWGELEDEIEDIDFTKIDMNATTQEELESWEEAFSRFFARHTKAELHREAVKRDIMLFPVNTIQDLLDDKQLQARKFWVNVKHPELDATIIYPGAPFKSTQTSWGIRRRAPLIGEHNEEIFERELGITKHQLSLLKKQGVI